MLITSQFPDALIELIKAYGWIGAQDQQPAILPQQRLETARPQAAHIGGTSMCPHLRSFLS